MALNTHFDDADYSKTQKLLFLGLGILLLIVVTLLLTAIFPKSLTDRPEASIDAVRQLLA